MLRRLWWRRVLPFNVVIFIKFFRNVKRGKSNVLTPLPLDRRRNRRFLWLPKSLLTLLLPNSPRLIRTLKSLHRCEPLRRKLTRFLGNRHLSLARKLLPSRVSLARKPLPSYLLPPR